MESMYRHWKYTKTSMASAWGAVFAAYYETTTDSTTAEFDINLTKEIIKKDLERMPISQITWPTSARNRRDIYQTPYISRWDRWGDR